MSGPNLGRVVAIDLGAVRVGVAVSDSRRILATPVTILERADDAALLQAIAEQVRELQATLVVVGLPRQLSGESGIAARAAEEFALLLGAQLEVPVELHDERLSSVEATRRIRESRPASRSTRSTSKVRVDDVAAAVFLQSYLDRRVQ